MKKLFAASVLASVSALAVMSMVAAPTLLAQAASDQITIKDPAEFNAYQNAITQTDKKAQAQQIEGFLVSYPQSVVKKSMLDTLVDDYSTFDPAKTVDAGTRMLQLDPNNLKSMYLIVYFKKGLAAQAAGATPPNTTLQGQLLDDAATVATKGLTATKPAEIKDDVWKNQKLAGDLLFHSIIAYDDLYSKKDLKGTVAEFRSELEMTPVEQTKSGPALSDTLVLGQTYVQLTPPDMVNGIWFIARADNFAPPAAKAGVDKLAKYWYKRYHGKDDGFDKVLAASALTVFPPADFTIAPAPTAKDIADNVVATTTDLSTLALGDKEYILANASTANAEKLWAILKDQLTEIPGTVMAASATEIQVAVTDDAKADKKADFTVKMKTPLADKDIPAVGSETKSDDKTESRSLIGNYDSYTQSPAQIIIRDGEWQVEKKKAPVTHKPSPAHKKPASTTPAAKPAAKATKASS
jgi:hypothetical protein